MISSPLTPIAAAMAIVLAFSPATSGATHRCPTCKGDGGRLDTLVAYPAASSIRWSGMTVAPFGASAGSVPIVRGELLLRHGELAGGSFVVDMSRLRIDDPDRTMLRRPFVAADAFEVKRYPTAAFVATGATRTGDSTWSVNGNLTLHGVTRPVSFSSGVHWAEVGHMIATADLTLDRREFGIASTGSVADHIVDNAIQLTIRLDARRRGAVMAER
jgi:polyisoprenoid-binding protein YceI